jgi:predicted nuclease of predicted toxin-antitoxin system
MRLCANENIGQDMVARLRAAGHDVVWIRETAPGIPDAAVLSHAQAEARLLPTFDKDFGDLVYGLGASASYGVILFRVTQLSAAVAAERICSTLASRTDWQGHYSVVDNTIVRMRVMPSHS